ncbi:hypothetical protein P7D68_22010, partial [Enterococcus avium]|uniref:hypothetical protein n=1 Tax=Enterococcus avium TaxID=33945 RepID=UPI002891BBCA
TGALAEEKGGNILFKKQNGKRRWRRILWLEGKHCRKDIRWYAEYDREIREDFHLTYPNQVWRHNTDWRQNSINEMNNWRLFVDKI